MLGWVKIDICRIDDSYSAEENRIKRTQFIGGHEVY